ncbi:hypothetical protein C7S18_06655 [Ahniella affigens]|uniref:Uncharacterized protein n=1 Tax=Ahniella affigens TaxID=2021234 RepID=A0A2P1PPX9_9GAMM|nr:hypothetical protein C7S18_06655 [Ahniella affigens]
MTDNSVGAVESRRIGEAVGRVDLGAAPGSKVTFRAAADWARRASRCAASWASSANRRACQAGSMPLCASDTVRMDAAWFGVGQVALTAGTSAAMSRFDSATDSPSIAKGRHAFGQNKASVAINTGANNANRQRHSSA